MCYQFRNGFNTGVSFVQHVLDAGESTFFCINYPNSAMIRLKTIVRENPLLAHRAFLIDSLVAHDSSKRWQDDIGHYRALLRGYVRVPNPFNIRLAHSSTGNFVR